jgi:uncharacterized protein YdbL (DUF1318 family)
VATEKRRGYLFGMGAGELITVSSMCIGLVWAAAVYSGQVGSNTNDILSLKKHTAETTEFLMRQIQDSEHRQTQAVQNSEKRVREDIQQIREILLRSIP